MKPLPVVVAILLAVACDAPLATWKNPSKSPSLNKPIFGTRLVAFKGYDRQKWRSIDAVAGSA